MNYLAHAAEFLDDPYFVAGTALPDWLGVVDRRVRVRSRQAEPHALDADQRVAALARGIVQHHADDDWFHRSDAFTQLHGRLTVLVRERLSAGDTDEEVVDYVVARYGEFVLLTPPFDSRTLILWLLAPALIVIGGGAALWMARRRRAAALLAEDEQREIDRILRENKDV